MSIINRINSPILKFPQSCLKFRLLILLCTLIIQTVSEEATAHHFASLPKCQESTLEDEIEIPVSLISSQDLHGITSKTVPWRLISDDSSFQCNAGKGRLAILQVSLHNLEDVTQVLTLFGSGYLLHDRTYYSNKEFCVLGTHREDANHTLSIKICEPQCSSRNHACVQKCCQPEKVWDLKHYSRGNGALSCELSGEKIWRPDLYLDQYEKMDPSKVETVSVRYIDAHPKNFCDGGFFLMTLKDYDGLEASPFRILKSGKAMIKIGRSMWEEVPSDMYCVDGAMNFINTEESGTEATSTENVFSGQYTGNPVDTVMLVCTGFLDDPEVDFDGSPNLLYVIAMIVASVFLFLTALVYAILWKRQAAHGWTFLGYVLSLLLTFVFLSTAHLANGEFDCTFVGIACHFFFLSTFTWLSALNFDIYWTFRLSNPNPGRNKEIVRFLCYSLFAVGVPVIIVTVGLVLDSIYGDDPESEVIVPRYGVTRCTMERSADFPYLFGPISFLLGCNLILFPTTLYHIYKSQKISKLSGIKNNMLRHKIRFFGRLFMLAGVTWIFEVISWACTEPGKPVHWIWKLLDLINILQAVAIFVLFVCNRKTLLDLEEKFPRFKRVNTLIEKASGVAVANPRKRQSNTHTNVSSVYENYEVSGLDVIELGGGNNGK